MAKVSIILSDTEEEGGVSCHVEFSPGVDEATELTTAQSEGAFLIELLQRRASGQTLAQIAEEMQDDTTFGGLEVEEPCLS